MGWNPLRVVAANAAPIAGTVQRMVFGAQYVPTQRDCADCESTLWAASAFLVGKTKKLKFATPYEPDG